MDGGTLRTVGLFAAQGASERHADSDSDGNPDRHVPGGHAESHAHTGSQRDTPSREL
jgi:hypothetical protein